MPKFSVGVARRLVLAAAAALAFALFPQLAQAQAPGSLTELGCIQAPTGSGECASNGGGLTNPSDVAVSPDGQNVYVAGAADDAVAEFTRDSGGTMTQLAAPNDCIADPSNDGTSSCADGTSGTGLVDPQSIVVSPDGQNVYVAAQDANGNGTIAELTRNSDGSLTPISGHECIAENINATDETSPCGALNQTAFGIQPSGVAGTVPTLALAISPDGKNVYVVDEPNEDIAVFSRAADGTLSQAAAGCIADATVGSTECGSTATGISEVTGVAVSPEGNDVYTVGFLAGDEGGTIAEFTRNATDGSLTQPDSPANCVEQQGDDVGCGTTAIGVAGIAGLVISPDGRNLYTASETFGGPIAEFSRDANGALSQLPAPNDCFQEGGNFGCSNTGIGIASGFRLAISSDGASVYAAAPDTVCSSSCSDVAEFARYADGSLHQSGSPDSCIQDANVEGSECPGNENGRGLGGTGLAISPDGASLYVTGGDNNAIAAFARTPSPELTVSPAGSGSGAVSDASGTIICPSTCSHAFGTNSPVTLTATPASGSTFAGWGGACSGTGTCQVTMSADMAVTATFTGVPGAPGQPAPVLTGAPTAVTDAGAGFSGSVNPEGLPTTVFFQYGLDKRYSQVGASGPSYTQQTTSQSVGSDFTAHSVGPVTVSGLVPNALYHVRLVATNSAGTTFGQDVTFRTKLAPAPLPPTLGQSVNIAPVSGLVLVLIHGHLVPLTQIEQIPLGVVIDSLHGTFQLTTAIGGGGSAHDAAAKGKRTKTQRGQFGGAVVRLHQVKSGANQGLTTVMMVLGAFKGAPSQAICTAHGAGDAHAARAKSKTIQLLHASAHGKFTTSGRYSAATVRGTKWTMAARCDGTLVHDITDSVVVNDFVRHKSVVLHAGQSYLAPGPRKKHR